MARCGEAGWQSNGFAGASHFIIGKGLMTLYLEAAASNMNLVIKNKHLVLISSSRPQAK